jgi:hypothetical protein
MLKNQTNKIQRYRKLPAGSVLEIQLAIASFAYICVAKDSFFWLFDFVTNHSLRDADLLKTTRWKLPFLLWDYPPKAWRLVAVIELTDQEAKVPPMWAKINPNSMHYDVPTLYQVYSPGTDPEYKPYYYITEEQSKTHHPNRSANSNTITEFIKDFLPDLERIEIPEVTSGNELLPKVKLPPQCSEPPPIVVEVQFPCFTEDLGMEDWEIGDAFDDVLKERDLGLTTTVDSSSFSLCENDEQTGFSAEFSVVLEIAPRRLKAALTQIRKTIKELKAPPTTRIVEIADGGNITHPLIAALKGK